MIDALRLLITAHQGAAEERVAEIMDAWQGIVAAPDPAQSRAEAREGVMHHAIAQGRALIGDEERLNVPITHATPTGTRIFLQCRHRRGMEWHQA